MGEMKRSLVKRSWLDPAVNLMFIFPSTMGKNLLLKQFNLKGIPLILVLDVRERKRETEKEKDREAERGHTHTYTQRSYAYTPWHTVEVRRQH